MDVVAKTNELRLRITELMQSRLDLLAVPAQFRSVSKVEALEAEIENLEHQARQLRPDLYAAL